MGKWMQAFVGATALVGLVGCPGRLAGLFEPGLVGKSSPSPSPSTWYEPVPTDLALVSAEGPFQVGQPFEITARVVIGSSSCNRYRAIAADVEPGSTTIRVSATIDTLRSSAGDVPCTMDFGTRLATVSVTVPASGIYRIVAERFSEGAASMGETPRATLDVLVK
jgi:hypothetical protein